jgi:hypothetical protein
MIRGRFLITSVLMGVVLLAAGCGRSGDDTSTSTQVLTKEAFIQRADEICERIDEVQRKRMTTYLAKQSKAALSRTVSERAVVAAGLPPLWTEVAEMDALPAPEGDEEEIQAIIEGIEEAIRKGEADPGSLVNSKSAGPFDDVAKLAREYGFKACAFPL